MFSVECTAGASNGEGEKCSDLGSVLRGDPAGFDAIVQFSALPYDYQRRDTENEHNIPRWNSHVPLTKKKLLFDHGGGRSLAGSVGRARDSWSGGTLSFCPSWAVETTYKRKKERNVM